LISQSIKITGLFLTLFVSFILLSAYSLLKYYDVQKVKNIINFFIFFSVAAIVINNCSADKIIKFYYKLTKIFIFFALLQWVLYYLNIGTLYTYSFLGLKEVNISTSGYLIRLFSIASEPAALCGILLPAIYLSINRIVNKGKEVTLSYSVIVLFVILNTFSLVGYIYIIICLIVALYVGNKISLSKIFIFTICLALLVFILFQSDSIQQRLNEITSLDKMASSDNLSVIAIYSNLQIALISLSDNLIFGGGIFSHPYTYDHYISQLYAGGGPRMELNKDDAASLYIRALSETGILGFCILNGLIIYLMKRCDKSKINYPYNIAFTIAFALLGIRAGSVNYIIIWFYFFSAIRFVNEGRLK
ncbi:O168 family O-antigen polymerase, partial [Escherichia coli]